jgi:hypothetical protein
MDPAIADLVTLMDQATGLAEERLAARTASGSDPSSVKGLEQIISGPRYRKDEALNQGFEVSESYVTLGLNRAALEYDVSDSDLMRKIGEIERYFLQHFVKDTPRTD